VTAADLEAEEREYYALARQYRRYSAAGRIQIHIDEDAMDSDLVSALGSGDVTVFAPPEAAKTGEIDEQQSAFATEHGCVFHTRNIPGFSRLHAEWINSGREHAGIILAWQQRSCVGEPLRPILHIRATTSAERMRNRLEFPANWG
jgi:hypothetical protein